MTNPNAPSTKNTFPAFSSIVCALVFSIAITGCGKDEDLAGKAATSSSLITNNGPTIRHSEEPSIGGFICSYAPSQSELVKKAIAVGGGSAVAVSGVASAAGTTAVLHSSGAYILTGAGGYVAGSLGAAAAIPVTITIGAFVGFAGGALELSCIKKNHPDTLAQISEDLESAYGSVIETAGLTFESITATMTRD